VGKLGGKFPNPTNPLLLLFIYLFIVFSKHLCWFFVQCDKRDSDVYIWHKKDKGVRGKGLGG
jgi:hypothetical protein